MPNTILKIPDLQNLRSKNKNCKHIAINLEEYQSK